MQKRRLLLIASFPLAVVISLGLLALLPSRPGVTKANFDRIQKGMTMTEVEQILGREGKVVPIGYLMSTEESEELFGGDAFGSDVLPSERNTALLTWVADDGAWGWARIRFLNDCVTGKSWTHSDETILDKFRRWLHRD